MDIQQQKEILLKWIRSCQTAEQIDLLSQRITEFVVKRFSDKIEYYEMELAKGELSDAIIEQRVITARERQPIRWNTHLRIIPRESYYLSWGIQASQTTKIRNGIDNHFKVSR